MKKHFVFLVFSFITLLSHGQSQKLVLQTNFIQEGISYWPLNGIQLPFYSLGATTHPNSDRTSEINLLQDQSVYNVVVNRKLFKVYSMKNSTDTVYMYNDSLYFEGENKSYNQYLTQIEESDKYCHNYSRSRDHELFSVNSLSDFKAEMLDRKRKDKQLIDNYSLSDEFVKQQQHFTDLRYYALFLNKMKSMHNDSSQLTEDWINEFKNVKLPLMANTSRQSEYFYSILEDYVCIKNFMLEGIEPKDVIDSFNTFLFDNFCKIADGQNLEYALAYLLYNDIFQEDFSRDIPSLYNRFIALFPNSQYIELLESEVQKITDLYNQKINSKKIVHMEYQTEPSNFEEMMRPFLGKVVFIDIWATWCAPCIKSFSEVGNIKEKLGYLDDVEIFYISLDQDSNHDKWLKLINYYNLEGYHYRVNEHTTKIVHTSVSDSKEILSIPCYIIVDRNGKIAYSNATSPSDENVLAEQLKTLLK